MRSQMPPLARHYWGVIQSIRHRQANLSSEVAVVASRPEAEKYQGLNPRSLVFAALRPQHVSSFVNLVLPSYKSSAVFAGIKTALEVGVLVARQTGLPLRVITLSGDCRPSALDKLRRFVFGEFGFPPQLVWLEPAHAFVEREVSPDDYWIATYWTTAHALDIAARLGSVPRERVIYLIQDYEPGFVPWSTSYAIAQTTYHARFAPLINSIPLRKFLASREHLDIASDTTFAPSLDLKRLESAATNRKPAAAVRILFYGRPSKPRNMHALGLSALKSAAKKLELLSIPAEFRSVGENYPSRSLTHSTRMKNLGALPWAEYFSLLERTEIVVSLQASPHPSHPPLDAVVSGITAITNEMAGTRGTLHENLYAVQADPDAIGDQIVESVQRQFHGENAEHVYSPDFLAKLGRPIEQAVAATLNQMS